MPIVSDVTQRTATRRTATAVCDSRKLIARMQVPPPSVHKTTNDQPPATCRRPSDRSGTQKVCACIRKRPSRVVHCPIRSRRRVQFGNLHVRTEAGASGLLLLDHHVCSKLLLPLVMIAHRSSRLSQWAKRYDSLRYSAQLDQCCRQLEEAQEYPSDRFLVHLVRLQRIVQRIERKVPIDDLTPETTIPIAMFVKSLHGELLEYKHNLPRDMAEHRLSTSA